MARLGGNRARALFQVMPVPFGSSMTGAGRPLRAPSGVDDTPRTLLLRWRTVGSATMDELRQIPSPGGVSQVLRMVVSGDSGGDGAGCGGEGAVGGGRCIRAVTSGVVMVQVERDVLFGGEGCREVPPTCRGLSLSLPVSNLHFTGAEEGAGLLAHLTQPLLTYPVYQLPEYYSIQTLILILTYINTRDSPGILPVFYLYITCSIGYLSSAAVHCGTGTSNRHVAIANFC